MIFQQRNGVGEMKIEVKPYTYENMPDYSDVIEGAKEICANGDEVNVDYICDVVYEHHLTGDLHLQILQPSVFNDPDRVFPCVIYVQGSAWKEQKRFRSVSRLGKLAEKGYVVAIVEYRHSGIAHHPAQVIDAKNAIRFMKKHAEEYHADVHRFILMGSSSGGQVACLAGMTAKSHLLDEPNDASITPEVAGIIDLYGAVDITLSYGFPTTLNHQTAESPEGMLVGYDIREHLEEAKGACAVSYVNEDFPPVLILHGSKDRSVFCEQSAQLYQALKKAGKDAAFYIVRHADHGGGAFWTEEAIQLYHSFIQYCFEKQSGNR